MFKRIATEKWGGETYTSIPITIEYDSERDAADMRYKFRFTLGALNNGHYFNLSIRTDVTLDGVKVIENLVLKSSSPSSWANPIVVESDWVTITRTTGETALTVRVYSPSGRDNTYTYSLPILPAGSDFTVGDIVIGSNANVSINRNDPTFTHSVIISLGTKRATAENISTVATIPIPMDWNREVISADYGMGTVTVRTYSGATLIGESTKVAVFRVPTSVVPTVSMDVTGTYDLGGLYIQGKTRLTITASHNGAYGSSIVAVNIIGAGYSGNADTLQTGELNVTGDVTITVTVTDSRGRTGKAAQTITVLAYSKPTLSVTSCYRCDDAGTATEAGTFINAKASFACSPLNGHNAISCTVSFRKKGGSWQGETLLFNDVSKVLFGSVAATDAYEVRFLAIDSVGEIAESITIINSSANYLLTAEKGKICLGGYVDRSLNDGTQVIGDLFINGKKLIDTIYPIGSVYISVNDVSPSLLIGGTWDKIEDKFLLASGNRNPGDTGGAETHTIVRKELPNDTMVFTYIPDGAWSTGMWDRYETTFPCSFPLGFPEAPECNTPFSILPPYLAVNMWIRRA